MFLLLVLVLSGNQSIKIPDQEPLASYESAEAKEYTRNLYDTNSTLAQAAPMGIMTITPTANRLIPTITPSKEPCLL
jgi:hypothetical protein